MSLEKIENSDLNWVEAILTVHFDLEEGQVVDFCYPKNRFSEDFTKRLGYFSFPDSYVFSPEGELYFSFQLKDEKNFVYNCYSYFTQKKDNTNPRGYFQKSIVIISKLRIIKVFQILIKSIKSLYFKNKMSSDILSLCLDSLNKNENPEIVLEKKKFILKILEKDIKVLFKRVFYNLFSIFKRLSSI